MNAIVCDCCKKTVTHTPDYCSMRLTSTHFANEHFDLCPKCALAIRAVIKRKAGVVNRNETLIPVPKIENEE